MADVQIQQTPERGGTNWIWAVVILILVAVIAWFIVGGRADRAPAGANVEVTVPAGGEAPAKTP